MTTGNLWRLLVMLPRSGAENMAIDQAITDLYAAEQVPTLRFYRWTPACLSLGLGQRLERDVDQAACAELGIDIVRRPTGGRAILHDQEVTYSLVAASDDPLVYAGSIVQSYRAISHALCAGLAQLGIAPELAPAPSARSAKSAACFDLPSDYEITLSGRKLVGSAQARQQGAVLQHGSILLHADAEAWTRALKLPPSLDGLALARRLIALDEALGYTPSFDAVVAALIRGFEQCWQIVLVPGALTPAEEHRAAELLSDKYGHPAWTTRR
ncbi:MAG TPA: lipoate--protein ligase family protein [Herpetosiphonaceae bacterium]